ncbi:MAG: hypothetical protein JW718_02690 [Desulfovibrionaceae bacterium]|nr:hypothetical protein [Desulfovibrionaceae bacterium]
MGNCQVSSLGHVFQAHGRAAKHLFFPSLGFGRQGLKESKRLLGGRLSTEGLSEAMGNGRIYFQPGLEDLVSLNPERIVVSLPHEYCRHPVQGQKALVPNASGGSDQTDSCRALEDLVGPLFYCRIAECGPEDYFERFCEFVARVRRALPGVPIVIIKRLSPLAGLGPTPFSWLSCWKRGFRHGYTRLAGLQRQARPCHVVDYDRILARLIASGREIDEFTDLTFFIEPSDLGPTLRMGRDIEHLGGEFEDAVYREALAPSFEPLPEHWPPPWTEALLKPCRLERALPEERLGRVQASGRPALAAFLADCYGHMFKTMKFRVARDSLSEVEQLAFRTINAGCVTSYLESRRRVVLYGAGTRGRTLCAFLREVAPECEVLGFLDSNPGLWGTRVMGLPVAGPDRAHEFKAQAVVVASFDKRAVAAEVRARLERCGQDIRLFTGLNELFALYGFGLAGELTA